MNQVSTGRPGTEARSIRQGPGASRDRSAQPLRDVRLSDGTVVVSADSHWSIAGS
jgi:hypothetical protein